MIIPTVCWGAVAAALFVVPGFATALFLIRCFEIEESGFSGPWIQEPDVATILVHNFVVVALSIAAALILRVVIPWPIVRCPIMVFVAGKSMVPTGASVGVFLFAASKVGTVKPTIAALTTHGIIEIPAASGILGCCLALTAAPGSSIPLESLVIFGVLAVALAIAAFVEAYVSPWVGRWVADKVGVCID